MNASYELHNIGHALWVRTTTIRGVGDWVIAKQYAQYIKELICVDGAFDASSGRVLAYFFRLHTLSIDAHSDVILGTQNQFSYRDLFEALPSSLRRLDITRAHGPDARAIAIVRECSPYLEELRLGRCTMFNSHPVCDFWRSFPFDHDSYMSDQGTDTYAHSLAQELLPLRSLKHLRLGLYLIPSTTVLAHRLYHRRGITAPAILEWQQPLALIAPGAPGVAAQPMTRAELISLLHEPDPESEFGSERMCTMCLSTTDEDSRRVEREANLILKGLLPSLETIQWMSWFTPGHLGFNSYLLSKPN
ncbi:hypothetical protein RhiJN_17428 [Ceratobasidium sp. AG-Ba]|nr:hypothetical protein RhiJN_17428 [Ceratobasidium sp. AG-Ba]